jgi:hypothetical protein
VLRDEIRPFVRTAGPFTDDLRLAARDVSKATPDLGTALEETNRFFNIGAYNPGGAEALAGLSVPQQRSRSEGFLYWLGWAAQNGVSLFSSADAQGPWRRVTICKVPALVLNGLINEVVTEVGASNPGLIQQLIGGTGSVVQPGSPIDQLLGTGFGSCDFAALPTP